MHFYWHNIMCCWWYEDGGPTIFHSNELKFSNEIFKCNASACWWCLSIEYNIFFVDSSFVCLSLLIIVCIVWCILWYHATEFQSFFEDSFKPIILSFHQITKWSYQPTVENTNISTKCKWPLFLTLSVL